ncbi:hypothetical protein HQO84_16740 [Rhodococcus fascians]|nr:hypothetical protein [Rhodococcus fascians]MBY3998816.1 hypothetical protein [Rhodococcus fascians]MBY4003588.1 hypothetical protein [Rhodococcus fascians]MBY4008338.1 hypothetical protein [Rhodococcus fascians]MBY4018471.1 hypothetical protein [Rhodococcus fascians]
MTIVNQQGSSHLPPVKYTHTKLDDFMFEKFGRTVEGPAKSRLMKVARAKFADEIEQSHAIARAGQEELATVVEPSTAMTNVVAFQRDMNPQLVVKAGEPSPYLETRRPHWSDRSLDQRVLMPEDSVAAVEEMSWRSRPIVMPLTNQFYGLWQQNGSFKTASIMADVRQTTRDVEPRIAFERYGFKDVNGKVENITGVHQYTLTLAEAANLARGLLLLVDLATETAAGTGDA